MPGLASKVEDGGIGFDYRMAMGIPDFWIRYIKEVRLEDWKVGHIYWELTNRRVDEKTVSYAESHDQALVGDKTIIFRLIDSDMYWHMKRGTETLRVNVGVALHKMIRLFTATTINGAYLNFMGNEFGHPEWVDFPREGNGWSHKYARRQWELADNPNYLYHGLGQFDKAMLDMIHSVPGFNETSINRIWDKEGDQVIAYQRDDLIFVFNFNVSESFTDYGILVDSGRYKIILNTDNPAFEGNGLVDEDLLHFSHSAEDGTYGKERLNLYIPACSAFVLKKQ
jgi:1,4-alpha-glucan branching enzyme